MWIAAERTGFCTRLYIVDQAGQIAEKAYYEPGPDDEFIAQIKDFSPADAIAVVTCGMAQDGFRIVPATPLAETLTASRLEEFTRIGIAGLRQANPAAVTSGAEARIAGFLALNPDFDGVLCIADHETLWAHISAKEVVSMQVFATCILAQRLTGSTDIDPPSSATSAFDDALSDTISKPERLAAKLASARAETILQETGIDHAQASTWGALLGAELAATRPYWLGQQVAVIAEPKLGAIYAAALRKQGLAPIQADGEAMLLKGFAQAWERCKS